MSALSVAVVRARYNPYGGAERYTQRAMAALGAAGVQLTVIARRWPTGPLEGLPVRLTLLKVDPFHIGSLWRDWSFARGVRQVLRSHRFDLVQSHERVAGVGLYRAGDGVHAAYLEQRRRVLPGWRAAALSLDPHHRWVLREERAMFTHPALRAVICNASAVLEDIHRRFGVPRERLHLLRNGLDLERFAPPSAEQREQSRRRFGLAAQATVFAFEFVDFFGIDFGLLEFLELVAQQFDTIPFLAGPFQRRQAIVRVFPQLIGAKCGLTGGTVTAVSVQQLALHIAFHELLAGMLGMHIDQLRADVVQKLDGYRARVAERP